MNYLKKRRTLTKTFICITAIFISILAFSPPTTIKASETEIGRASANVSGANISEILTYEMVGYDDANDQGTYRIRYYLEHSGDYYAEQNVAVGIFVDGNHVATFDGRIGDRVVNGTQQNGEQDIVVSAGVSHHVEMKDMASGGDTVVNMSTDIYLPYKKFNVTYKDWNGTVLKSEEVEKYSDSSTPENPNRIGHTFTGWLGSSGYITSDTEITAQYSINYYTVRYLDYDNRIISSQSIPYGSNATTPSNPNRTGYTFTGWSTNGNTITDNRDIVAQYRINTYAITFSSNGGSSVSPQNVTYQAKVARPADPTRSNYKFMGWYSDVRLTSAYDFNAPIGASGFTLYAKWNAFPTLSTPTSFSFYENELSASTWQNTERKKNVSANDTEDGNITSKIAITDNVKTLTAGTYSVNYSISDSVGNKVTKSVPVTVRFNNPPVITVKNKSWYENEITEDAWKNTYRMQNITATDIEDGNLTSKISIVSDNVDVTKPGTYQVKYSVTDRWGKSDTKISTVTIKYNNPPKLTMKNKSYFENEISRDTWTKTNRLQGISASDVEDGNITSKIEVLEDRVNLQQAGTYKVKYRVIDRWGKSDVQYSTITIKQNTPPEISIPSRSFYENELSKDRWETLRMQGVSAKDVEDGNLTAKIKLVSDAVVLDKAGNYNITYQVSDKWGKTTTKTEVLTIKANKAPVIKGASKTYYEGQYDNSDWDDLKFADITALDTEDGDLTSHIKITSDDVNLEEVGMYYVTYTVVDAYGKKTDKQIGVQVKANIPPIIIAGNKSFYEDEYTQTEWEDTMIYQDVSATDTEDGDITSSIVIVKNNVNLSTMGDYIVVYQVSDAYGKTTTKQINVQVKENHKPTLQLFADNQTFVEGQYTLEEWVADLQRKGVSAHDKEDNDLTDQVEVTKDNVDPTKTGTYEVTYRVTDAWGKSVDKTIKVFVQANKVPELFASELYFSNLDKITEHLLLEDVYALDDHDGDLTKKVTIKSHNVRSGIAGEYYVTYSVTDSLHKTSQKQVKVIIRDATGSLVPPSPPEVTDPEALQLWNGRSLGNVEITKYMEDANFVDNGSDDVVFGVYAAEDILYKGEVVLKKDALVGTTKIDENGKGYVMLYTSGRYYAKELATNDHYQVDQNQYPFTFER